MLNTFSRVLVFLLLIPIIGFSQKKYNPPKHSLGLEVSWSASVLASYRNNVSRFPLQNTGYGGSFIIPYQYASKSSFIGLQSGVGFFMWGGTYRSGWSILESTESLYSVGVPLVAQFKVGSAFWLEGGVQTNFAVYNSMRYAGDWPWTDRDPPGSLPIGELQGVFGFRYHFFQSFSFKARLHYGLTPAFRKIEYRFPDPNTVSVYTLRYRFIVFEMGLSYLFPLKK
jgi:hypothetical protein